MLLDVRGRATPFVHSEVLMLLDVHAEPLPLYMTWELSALFCTFECWRCSRCLPLSLVSWLCMLAVSRLVPNVFSAACSERSFSSNVRA